MANGNGENNTNDFSGVSGSYVNSSQAAEILDNIYYLPDPRIDTVPGPVAARYFVKHNASWSEISEHRYYANMAMGNKVARYLPQEEQLMQTTNDTANAADSNLSAIVPPQLHQQFGVAPQPALEEVLGFGPKRDDPSREEQEEADRVKFDEMNVVERFDVQ